MTTAIMAQTQVFIGLTIVDDNRMLFRPIVPVTILFFLFLSVYQRWMEAKELANSVVYLLDSMGMVLSLYVDLANILIRSLAYGMGVRL